MTSLNKQFLINTSKPNYTKSEFYIIFEIKTNSIKIYKLLYVMVYYDGKRTPSGFTCFHLKFRTTYKKHNFSEISDDIRRYHAAWSVSSMVLNAKREKLWVF